MDGFKQNTHLSPHLSPKISDKEVKTFTFDLQRFDFAINTSAPSGALFSVVKSEGTYYGTAVADFTTDNLKDATTITLLGNIDSIATAVTISSSTCTLDLGAYKLSGTVTNLLTSKDGTLTITGTEGSIETTSEAENAPAVLVESGTLNLQGGTIKGIIRGINVSSGSTLNMTGGTITAGSTTKQGTASRTVNLLDGNQNSHATFTMTGGNITNTGKNNDGVNSIHCVVVGAYGTFTMGTASASSNTEPSITGNDGVWVRGNAKFTMDSGTITSNDANGYAITFNGTDDGTIHNNPSIAINKGVITSEKSSILYLPAVDGEVVNIGTANGNVNDVILTGATGGIEIRAGKLNIYKCTINVDSKTPYAYDNNGNGSTTNGAGIAVAQHTTQKSTTVNIDGAVVNAPVAVSVANPEGNNSDVPVPTVTITSGTFTGSTEIDGIVSAINNSDSRVTVAVNGGTFTGAFTNQNKYNSSLITTEYSKEKDEAEEKKLDNGGKYAVAEGVLFTDKSYAEYGNYGYEASGTNSRVIYVAQLLGESGTLAKSYSNLAEAIADAEAGKITIDGKEQIVTGVRLLANVTLNSTLKISKAVTLDLSTYNITTASGVNTAIEVTADSKVDPATTGNLTLTGTTGKITVTGTTDATGIKVADGASLTVGASNSGPVIEVTTTSGKAIGIQAGAEDGKTEGSVTINGGSITASSTSGTGSSAIDIKGAASLEVTGGTITGGNSGSSGTGITFAGNTLTVSGGTITSNVGMDAISVTKVKDGSSAESPAITISGTANITGAQDGIEIAASASVAVMKITGGTITGTDGSGVVNNGTGALTVSGGTIAGNNSAGYGINQAGGTGAVTVTGTPTITGKAAPIAAKKDTSVSVATGVKLGTTSATAITDGGSNFLTKTAGSESTPDTYNGGAATLVKDGEASTAVSDSTTWTYTYGWDNENKKAKTITFKGKLFSETAVASFQPSQITLNESAKTITIDKALFDTTDKNSIQVTDATDTTLKGSLKLVVPSTETTVTLTTDDSFTVASNNTSGTYTFAGANTNGYALSQTTTADDTLTYHKQADSFILTATGATFAATGTDALKQTAATYITATIPTAVTIKKDLFLDANGNSTLTDGATFTITNPEGATTTYTLSAFADVTNPEQASTNLKTHNATASFAVNADGNAYLYKSAGTKAECFEASNGTLTYHPPYDCFKFAIQNTSTDTTKDIAFGTTLNPSYFTITDGAAANTKVVTINNTALLAATQNNGATLKIESDENESPSGVTYSLAIGALTEATGTQNESATFNASTKQYVGAGSTTAGYKVSKGTNDNDTLTYYQKSPNFTFVLSGLAFDTTKLTEGTTAAKYFVVDGTKVSIAKKVNDTDVTLSSIFTSASLTDGGTISIASNTDNYTMDLGDWTDVTSTYKSADTFADNTYQSQGALTEGFTVASGTLTYHPKSKAYFTFETGDDYLTFSNSMKAANFKVDDTQNTVAIIGTTSATESSFFSSLTDGKKIKIKALTDDETTAGFTQYKLVAENSTLTTDSGTYVSATTLTQTSTTADSETYKYQTQGSTTGGFVAGTGDDANALIYHQKSANCFTLEKAGTTVNDKALVLGTKTMFSTVDGKTVANSTLLGYIKVAEDGTVTIDPKALTQTQDANATLKITPDTNDKNTYKFAIGSLTAAGDYVDAKTLTVNSDKTYTYQTEGAKTAGYEVSDATLTYRSASENQFTLGAAGTSDTAIAFNPVTSARTADKFFDITSSDGYKTIKIKSDALASTQTANATLKVISGQDKDGLGYVLALGDGITSAANYNAKDTFTIDSSAASGTKTATYQTAGAQTAGYEANKNAAGETEEGTIAYRAASEDVIKFTITKATTASSSNTQLDFATATTDTQKQTLAGYVTVTKDSTDSTGKKRTVTINNAALLNLTGANDGDKIEVADGNTSGNTYTLDIGSLTDVTKTYNATGTATITKASTGNTFTYQGAGADKDGFVAEKTAGVANGTLTFHKKATDIFTFEADGDTAIAFASAVKTDGTAISSASTYFTVGTADATTKVKTVTIKADALKGVTQTDGATLKISSSSKDADNNTYTLVLDSAINSTGDVKKVEYNTTATFNPASATNKGKYTTTGGYTTSGTGTSAVKTGTAGYVQETTTSGTSTTNTGVITYRDAATDIGFDISGIAFASIAPASGSTPAVTAETLASYIDFDKANQTVTINSANLFNLTGAGTSNTVALDSTATANGYTLAMGTGLTEASGIVTDDKTVTLDSSDATKAVFQTQGAQVAGFKLNSDKINYYKQSNDLFEFQITAADSSKRLAFKTTNGTTITAKTLGDAVTVTAGTAASGITPNTVTIDATALLNTTNAQDGDSITIVSKKDDETYTLTGLTSGSAVTYSATAKLTGSAGNYTYTGKGANADGLVIETKSSTDPTPTGVLTYRKKVEDSFTFATDTVKVGGTTGTDVNKALAFEALPTDASTFFTVGDANSDNIKTVTIQSAALKASTQTDANSSLKIATATGYDYSYGLGLDSSLEAKEYIDKAQVTGTTYRSDGATTAGFGLYDSNTNDKIDYDTVVYRAKSANTFGFTFSGDISFTTKNESGTTLTGDELAEYLATKVIVNGSGNSKTVTVDSVIFDTSTLDEGESFYIATSGYSLAGITQTTSPGTYQSEATYSSRTYTGVGMTTADGFSYDSDSQMATFHKKADSFTFAQAAAGTTGIALNSTAANVASAITITTGETDATTGITTKKVALKSSGLSTTAPTNGAVLSITDNSATTRVKYVLSLATADGSDLDVAQNNQAKATITSNDSGYVYKGVGSDNGGYYMTTDANGNETGGITYSQKAETFTITGTIKFKSDLTSDQILAGLEISETNHTVAIKDTSILDTATFVDGGTLEIAAAAEGATQYKFVGSSAAAGLATTELNSGASFSKGTSTGGTYTFAGANANGIVLSESGTSFTYKEKYKQITFGAATSTTGMTFNDPPSDLSTFFEITDSTEETTGAVTKTIKIKDAALSTNNAAGTTIVVQKGDSSDTTTYKLALETSVNYYDAERIVKAEGATDTSASNYTWTGVGADAAGNAVNSAGTQITKYAKYDSFSFSTDSTIKFADSETLIDNFTVNNKQVKITQNAFDASTLTNGAKLVLDETATTAGYTLARGVGMTAATIPAAGIGTSTFEASASGGKYTAAGATTAGYVAGTGSEANTLTYYTKADTIEFTTSAEIFQAVDSDVDKVFVISGTSGDKTITINEGAFNKEKVKAAAAGTDKVTLSVTTSGYKLSLPTTYEIPTSKPEDVVNKAFGDVSENKAEYIQTTTTGAWWEAASTSSNTSYTLNPEVKTPETLFTLEGVKTVEDSMVSDSGTVTLATTNLADTVVAETADSTVKLTPAEGQSFTLTISDVTVATEAPAATTSYAEAWKVEGTTATLDRTDTVAVYWTKDGNTYTHHKKVETPSTVTLSGLKSGATVSGQPDADGKITLTAAMFDTTQNSAIEVASSDTTKTYTLTGIETAEAAEVEPADFATDTAGYKYTSKYDKAYYSADSTTKVSYHVAGTPTTFTISGLATGLTKSDLNSKVTVDDTAGTVTLTAEAVGTFTADTNSAIVLTDSAGTYKTLTLAETSTTEVPHAAAFTADENTNTTFNYKGAYSDAYFKSATATSYDYVASTESKAATFSVTNLDAKVDTAELVKAVDETAKTLTLTKTLLPASFTADAVLTISNGYKFGALDSTLAPVTTQEGFNAEIPNNVATYHNTWNTAGYKVDESDASKINYTAAVEEKTLFTLSGVANVDGITPADGKVTVAKSNIAESATTVSVAGDGYTLELSGVTTTKPDAKVTAAWSAVESNKATYIQTSTTAEYWEKSSDNKSYTFKEETAPTENLFSISGISTTSDITVKDKAVTVTSSAIATDANTVSVDSTDYTLTLSGVDTEPDIKTTNALGAVASDNSVKYIATTTTSDYWKKDSNQSYTFTQTADDVKTLFTLSGVKSKSGVTVTDSTKAVTVTSSAIADGVTTVKVDGTGYTLTLDGVETEAKTTTSEAWGDVANNKATYIQTAVTGAYWAKGSDNQSYTFKDTATATTDLFTVSGIKSTSGVTIDGTTVTVAASAIADNATSISVTGNYTLALTGVETEAKTTTSEAWGTLTDGKVSRVQTATTAAYWSKASNGKSYTFKDTATTTSDLFTLEGVKSTSGISVSGTTVTLNNASLNEAEVTLTGEGYKLALGSNVTQAVKSEAALDVPNQTYTTAGYTTAGYTLDSETKVSYNTKSTETIQFSGMASTAVKSGVVLSGKVFTIGAKTLGEEDFQVLTDGYTLQMRSNVTVAEESSEPTLSGQVYSTAGVTKAGYQLSDDATAINYRAKTATSVTFTGLSDTATVSDLSLSGTTFTVSAAALGTENVTVESGYTLALGSDVAAPTKTTAATLDVESQTYTTAGYTVAGYTANENTITYQPVTATEIQFSGLASTATKKNVVRNGKVFTIGAKALGTDDLQILTEGYTLKLGSSVKDRAVESTTAELDVEEQTYTTAGVTTAGYQLSDDATTISYLDKTAETIQFSGLASTATKKSVVRNGKTFTIGAAALTTEGVSVLTEGYKLKLGSSVKDRAKESTSAELDVTNQTYTTAGVTTAGYKLADDAKSISYLDQTAETIQFSGMASTAVKASFAISGTEITVGKAALGKEDFAVVTEGYTLKLRSNVPTDDTSVDEWSAVKSGKVSYQTTTKDHYVLAEDSRSVSYEAGTSTTSLELSGIASDAKLATASEGVVSLGADDISGNAKIVSNKGGYSFTLTQGDYTDKTFTGTTGADTIKAVGSNISVLGGKGADVLSATGTNTTLNGGDGGDILTGGANADYLLGGAGADTLAGGAGADTLLGGAGNDTLFGGNGTDSLNGGAGADTLNGGLGNDTLTGGAGKDTFVFNSVKNAGADVITDYVSGEDVISLGSDYTGYSFKGDDVVLGFKQGSLTIKDAFNKEITFADGTTATFNDDPLVENKTAILPADYSKDYTVGDQSGVQHVDGSATSEDISLIGDGKANSLIGGSGDNMIVGNAGKDTLVGNAGDDTLDGGTGNDLLQGNAGNDSLSGGAGADTLAGGNGADTLDGGVGNDSLNGGAGKDTFVYSGGKDTITSFVAKDDTIENISDYEIATNVSTDDGFLLTFNKSNTLLIANGKASSSIDIKTGDTTYTYTKDTVTDSKSATLFSGATSYTAGTGIVSIDGTAATAVIVGNAKANKISLDSGTVNGAAGADTITLGDGEAVVELSAGKDVVNGFDVTSDKLSVGSYNITAATVNSSATTFKFGSNTIKFNGLAEDARISLVEGGELTGYGKIDDGTYALFAGAGNASYELDSEISAIDASAVTKAVTLSSGTLDGTLTGGKGKDTFEYNGGDVTIKGFAAGETLNTGDYTTVVDYSARSSALTLTLANSAGTTGKVVIEGGTDTQFYLNGESATFTSDGLLYNSDRTAVTVTSSAESYDASKSSSDSGIVTIDGSNATEGLKLTGNANDNVISGGSGDDTISGNGGSDLLSGGSGADTFVHSSDTTAIGDYSVADGDQVSVKGLTASNIASKVASVTKTQSTNGGTLTVTLDDGTTVAVSSSEYSTGNNPSIQFAGISDAVSFGDNAVYSGNSVTLMSGFGAANGKFEASANFPADTTDVAIDASGVTAASALNLIGTAGNDTITSGGTGVATVRGGNGDDSLKGAAGVGDIFAYASGDGADVIADFTAGEDKVKVETRNIISSVDVSNKKLNISMTDGGSITVNNFLDGTKSKSSSDIFIKNNNTLYWFDDDSSDGVTGSDGRWVTASDSKTKSVLKTIMADSSYAVVDLDYSSWTSSSNLVAPAQNFKNSIGAKGESYFKNYKLK